MREHKTKRCLSLLLSLVMLLSFGLGNNIPVKVKAAGTPTISVNIDSKTLNRGDTATVTVDLSGNENAYGLQYNLSYDGSQLECAEVVNGTTGAFTFTEGALDFGTTNQGVNDDGSSYIRVVIAKSSSAIVNGNVITVKFKVLDTAANGTVNFTSDVMFTDESGEVIEGSEADSASGSKIVTAPTGVKITSDSKTVSKASVNAGETLQLGSVIEPADASGKVTWSSDNTDVATVDKNGIVTAVKSGSATITAKVGSLTATCKVTVASPLKSISIKGDADTVTKGQTTQLSVVYDPDDTTDDKTVTWSSDKTKVATVDETGLVKGKSAGTAVITATVGDKTATYEIKVKEIKLKEISIDSTALIHRGDSKKLTITYSPKSTTDSKKATWTSANESIVTVDAKGNVTAVAVGTTTVTATVGEFTSTCEVTVDAPLTSIDVKDATIELKENNKATISYTINPSDTSDDKTITFESSDSDIATVSAKGVVTAKKAGTAIITLTAANGVTAKVTVNVSEVYKDADVVVVPSDNQTATTQPSDGQTVAKPADVTAPADSTTAAPADTTTQAAQNNNANSPKTGDTVNIALVITLLILSMAGLVVIYLKKKREYR
jgi:LPXTG-motif cell wall-anchored protein